MERDSPSASRAAVAPAIRGRGTAENPANRFERLAIESDPEFDEAQWQAGEYEEPRPRTQYFRDPARSIIAFNDSPDLNFEASLNPYRGCEHGCVYCYARPMHEYLGFSAGLDFETRILVKDSAPELLRATFSSPKWKPQVVAVGAATDPYQPIEGRLRLTRRCLEVFAEFRNPLAIVTKSSLVARDADVLAPLVAVDGAAVNVSVTTLDRELARVMEPRGAPPARRLQAVRSLARAGVPVGVMVAPIIPGLTDHEIPRIVEASAAAGAQWIGHIVLRLPHGVADLFEAWLARHRPDRARKVMNRLLAMRGGRRNDPRFHSRMRGEGLFATQIRDMVELACRRTGIPNRRPELRPLHFRRPPDPQLSLFDD